MQDKDQAKRTAIMKMEAMTLFATLRAQTSTERWWYFREMRAINRPVRLDQSISPYRASLYWDYIFRGIECQVFLEREAHVGAIGEDMWTMSFSGIEGKVNALTLQDCLKPLQNEGYYIPNGNENLERQMNFSLGLYGACLMHVDVKFPVSQPAVICAQHVLDIIEKANEEGSAPLRETIARIDAERALNNTTDDSENDDIMMGDWQTWK